MPRTSPPPVLMRPGQSAQSLKPLPKVHSRFDEAFLQDLLAQRPDLLPVAAVRSDAGPLVCIGREIALPSGIVDNLYLSAGGYPVLVETKLWRNPQARREVLSQTLDYIKDLTEKDFEWLQDQWKTWSASQGRKPESLIESLSEGAQEYLDEHEFVDRVNRALARGDILAMIVGDGIETRLQELVDHLCRDSAHLRYVLTLCELAFYELGPAESDGLLVIPRIVSNVEPVERAYIRIDLAEALEGKARITPVRVEANPKPKGNRQSLSSDEFFDNVQAAVGDSLRRQIETAIEELCRASDLEAEFKESAVMLKLPDPTGDAKGASLLAFHRSGSIYNTAHMRGQLSRWPTIGPATAQQLCSTYWQALHAIDPRFALEGANHNSEKAFIPFASLAGHWPAIRELVGKTAEQIRKIAAEGELGTN